MKKHRSIVENYTLCTRHNWQTPSEQQLLLINYDISLFHFSKLDCYKIEFG